jgi:hypothetical protein
LTDIQRYTADGFVNSSWEVVPALVADDVIEVRVQHALGRADCKGGQGGLEVRMSDNKGGRVGRFLKKSSSLTRPACRNNKKSSISVYMTTFDSSEISKLQVKNFIFASYKLSVAPLVPQTICWATRTF